MPSLGFGGADCAPHCVNKVVRSVGRDDDCAIRVTKHHNVLKIGRMLAVTRVDIFDSEKRLAAHATVTYAFLR